MAKLTNTLPDVKQIGDIIAANNPTGLVSSLAAEGINVPAGYTDVLLSNLMQSIFANDKAKWVRIVKATPFNPNANNWTTSPETISSLNETVGNVNTQTGKAVTFQGLNLGDIFSKIGDFIGGSSTTTGGTHTTGNEIVGIFAVLVVGVIAGVSLWLIFKK